MDMMRCKNIEINTQQQQQQQHSCKCQLHQQRQHQQRQHQQRQDTRIRSSLLSRPLFQLLLLLTFISSASTEQEIIEIKYNIEEELPAGTYVGNVVNDANLVSIYDSTQMRQLQFKFFRPAISPSFVIDPITGVIETGASRLDRESICQGMESCLIRLDIGIQPAKFFRIIRATITLLDINDNDPTFASHSFVLEISEAAPVGSSYHLPIAEDLDGPKYSVVDYKLGKISPGSTDPFLLAWDKPPKLIHRLPINVDDKTAPRLTLMKQLDREKQNTYYTELVAIDGGSPARTGKIQIEIRVLDANDNAPIFERSSYVVSIPENAPIGSNIAKVYATDADEGLNGMVMYHLSGASRNSFGNIFSIDNKTGEIFSTAKLDFETKQSYQLIIEASDLGSDSVVVSTVVTINIEDVNDNPPQITVGSMTSSMDTDALIPEDFPIGSFVAHVSVNDLDSGVGGKFNCVMKELTGSSFQLTNEGRIEASKQIAHSTNFQKSSTFRLKQISETEFQILTQSELDRERQESYELHITCKDSGHPSLNSTKVVRINIEDVNDCTPTFRDNFYRVEIPENNYIGANIVKLSVDDCDAGDNGRVTFQLVRSKENFIVDPKSGLVKAIVSFDRESIGDEVNFTVVATDHGHEQRSGTVDVSVKIIDVNDNRPIFDSLVYHFNVSENLPINMYIGKVLATDADKSGTNNSKISYSLLNDTAAEYFRIDNVTGDIFTVKNLDREVTSAHYFAVTARDHGVPALSSSASVVVIINDKNDNAPIFEFPTMQNTTIQLNSRAAKSYEVTRFRATDLDSGLNGKVVYAMDNDSLLNNGFGELFHLDSTTGILTLLSEDITSMNGQVILLKIRAEDSAELPEGRQKNEVNVRVVINASAPLFINGQLVESSSWLLALGFYDSYGSTVKSMPSLFMILISVLVAILLVILIVTIACLKRRRRGNRKPTTCIGNSATNQYNCRAATLKMLSSLPESSTFHTELISSDAEFGRSGSMQDLATPLSQESRLFDDHIDFRRDSKTILNSAIADESCYDDDDDDDDMTHADSISGPYTINCIQQRQPNNNINNNSNNKLMTNLQNTYNPCTIQCWKQPQQSPNCCLNYLSSSNNNNTQQQQHCNNMQQQNSYQQQQQMKGVFLNRPRNTRRKNMDHGSTIDAETEAKHLLEILKEDAVLENLSISSDQGANSDSGKGGSEEGGEVQMGHLNKTLNLPVMHCCETGLVDDVTLAGGNSNVVDCGAGGGCSCGSHRNEHGGFCVCSNSEACLPYTQTHL